MLENTGRGLRVEMGGDLGFCLHLALECSTSLGARFHGREWAFEDATCCPKCPRSRAMQGTKIRFPNLSFGIHKLNFPEGGQRDMTHTFFSLSLSVATFEWAKGFVGGISPLKALVHNLVRVQVFGGKYRKRV